MLLMVNLLFSTSQVQAATSGDYTYTITASKAQITKYTGTGATVSIPSTLGGSPVTSIGNWAFANCTSLTSVSIPSGVTSIGNWSFSDSGLTSVSIPSGLVNIGMYAFSNCSALATIRFNSPTTKIYDDPNTIPTMTKIIGSVSSTSKDYATKYNRTFEGVGSAPSTNATLQSIAITTPATKLNYSVSDKLDITGLVVTGTYSDASTKSESITAANVTGFSSTAAAADQVLTITVGTKTTTYKVQIGSSAPATDAKVTGVTLNKSNFSIAVDATETLIATIAPTNAAIKDVTWKSSLPAVATIDSTGKIIGVKAGLTVIFVTTVDGNKTASCTVTVTGSTPISVTGVSLNKSSAALAIGASETLTATIAPANAPNKNVTWKSSVPAVATIDSTGKIVGVKAGTAVITVTTVDGNKTATCTVTVSAQAASVTGVKLNKSSSALAVGANETLTATITPATATNKNVTWKSSVPAVATVDSKGKIVGIKAGTAVITGTTADGNKTATCTVTVSAAKVSVTGVKLNKSTSALKVGANETLIATIAPTNATNKNITWKSSNPAVATVDSKGKIVGVKAGIAVISGTTADGNKIASCTVTVSIATTVTGISLNKYSTTLKVGASDKLISVIVPINAPNKNVTWKSSNSAVATVDSTGKILAKKVGTANITVTSVDGNMSSICAVKVIP